MSLLTGSSGRRAVFLDRDGTINIEKEYLYRPDEFEFVPGAPEGIALLNSAGFVVVVVTNQSGIARGYYGEDDVQRLHRHMDECLARAGARVDAYYYCPHHPVSGEGTYRIDCSCRKPNPGMLLMAADDLGIDLNRSWMVGDKEADLEAGAAAGCRVCLVRTGYGAEAAGTAGEDVLVCDNLLLAAREIITLALPEPVQSEK